MILGIEVFTAHIASGSIYLSLWPAGRPPPPAIGCGPGRWLPVWCFPTRWPQLWWSLSQPGPERAGSGRSSARNGRPPVQLSASSAPLERRETWNECDTCVFQTFFFIQHNLLQKKIVYIVLRKNLFLLCEPWSHLQGLFSLSVGNFTESPTVPASRQPVLHLSMHEFNSNRQFKRPKMLHSYVQQDTLHCVEFYDHPHLPWWGKALWTWPASGWTPPPAAAWVWWTRPSPAPELPLAAVAPLNDNEGGKKQNKISCWLHVGEKKSFKSKGKHPQKSVHSLRRLSHY